MTPKHSSKTELILTVLRIVAWLAFVGFLIQAGSILTSFSISWFNPEGSKNLYRGLDLSKLRQFNAGHYIVHVAFLVGLLILKAYVCLLVIKTLSKITLANPFTMEVAKRLEKMAYVLFGAWAVGLSSRLYSDWLQKQTGEIFESGATNELLFVAGLVYIVSQIFKRGVEIQSENELTV